MNCQFVPLYKHQVPFTMGGANFSWQRMNEQIVTITSVLLPGRPSAVRLNRLHSNLPLDPM